MYRTTKQQLLKRERYLRLAAVLSIILCGFIIILKVDDMLASCVLAFVINYTVAPIVNWLERHHVSRNLAILVMFILGGIFIFGGIYIIVPLITTQVQSLLNDAPQLQADLIKLVRSQEDQFKHYFNLSEVNFSETINAWLLEKTKSFSVLLPSAVTHSLSVLLFAPLFAYFMLQDGRKLNHSLLSLVPNSYFEMALSLQHKINEQLGGFIRARFLEGAIVGLVVWFGLQVMGFPFAPLLGICAALTNLIPYVGPIIGAVPAIAIALISPSAKILDSFGLNLLLVSSVYLAAQLIDILFIIPLVVAKIVNLHPALVIIVITIGAQLMGVLGMIISIPVASVLKLSITAVYEHLIEIPRIDAE